ncbi:MAG: DUF3168 domain-containing protein [Hyphomonas sp.]
MKRELMALLIGAPDLAALAPGGINWSLHPADVGAAYLVLSQISMTPRRSNTARSQPTRYRVQIDGYAPSALEAEELGRAVVATLDGHHADPFPGIFLIGASDMVEGDADHPIHRLSMDFTIIFRG